MWRPERLPLDNIVNLAAHEKNPQNNLEEVTAQLIEAAGEEAKEELVSMADWLREQGERTILLKQPRLRFGELSEAVRARVHAAGSTQIERWAELILTARTLDEVLGER